MNLCISWPVKLYPYKKTSNYWLKQLKKKRSFIEHLSTFPAPPRDTLLFIITFTYFTYHPKMHFLVDRIEIQEYRTDEYADCRDYGHKQKDPMSSSHVLRHVGDVTG